MEAAQPTTAECGRLYQQAEDELHAAVWSLRQTHHLTAKWLAEREAYEKRQG
jgi:hypothetical protein